MKTFTYSFDGEALGGEIVVVAKNREDADRLALEAFKERYPRLTGTIEKYLTFDGETKFSSKGQVVHFWDGDY